MTDHRGAAEEWLGNAEEGPADATACALIALTHQLGAILDFLLARDGAQAKIEAGLKVTANLDADPEWAKRQIFAALLDGEVTDGAP